MSRTRFIPLEPVKHKSIKLKNDPTFSHSKLFNFVNIGFNEIATLSGCMPLVLVHDEASDVLSLTCCLGFEGFGNVFYHERQWLGHAVPLSVQCYPFNYSIDEQRVSVLIDENSTRFTNIDDVGAALFSSDGHPTTLLKQQQENLAALLEGQQQANAFVDILKQYDLLAPLSVSITRASGQIIHSSNLYSVNEEKYAQLEADTIVKFHKEGISMAINAMLLSLRQYNRLVQLTESLEDPATRVGIKLNKPM
ncbi:SapC family protein [Alteromonas sp. KUL106]|uniref:SapC family protein n=1 Tax=Alteromonas sp. KUL106 TaxID=2480799 RepID=UPI0012E53AB7|nr:SapC family protein [Alteromonas sp. KUL106]GFD70308.1 hypothetical protein KUL106_35710 [Alteromonas sp. KUL106]